MITRIIRDLRRDCYCSIKNSLLVWLPWIGLLANKTEDLVLKARFVVIFWESSIVLICVIDTRCQYCKHMGNLLKGPSSTAFWQLHHVVEDLQRAVHAIGVFKMVDYLANLQKKPDTQAHMHHFTYNAKYKSEVSFCYQYL